MRNVILYSTGCPHCKVLKMKLDKKGISYVENNNIEAMSKLGMRSAPGLSVDGELYNFSEAVKWVDSQ